MSENTTANRISDGMSTAIVESATKLDGMGPDRKAEEMDELFKVNSLWYRVPPTLSFVSKRTMLRNNFQRVQYSNPLTDTMSCIFNTGEFYINPKTSYLTIQVGIQTDAKDSATLLSSGYTAYVLNSNIMQLFQDIIFTSASGTEIDRQVNKGLLSSLEWHNQFDKAFTKNWGLITGGNSYDHWTDPSNLNANNDGKFASNRFDGSVNLMVPAGTAFYTFCVRLSDILGCFNPYLNTLFPAAVLAGSRLDFRMKDTTESLTWGSNAAYVAYKNSIQISQMYLMLDAFQLQDNMLKRLNEVSAGEDGLTVCFNSWDWTVTNTTGTTVEAQVQQARSRIIVSVPVVRQQRNISNPYADSLASEPISDANNLNFQSVQSYQAQLGSLFFPQQPLVSREEMFMNHYFIWCKALNEPLDTMGVTPIDFYGYGGLGMYDVNNVPVNPAGAALWRINSGVATLGMLAERSTILQLSGLPISNARLLRHRFVFNSAVAGGRQIDVFTKYTKLLKCWLGGRCVLRE